MLSRCAYFLDVGIDSSAIEFFIGCVQLTCLCTLYDTLFKMINVVI